MVAVPKLTKGPPACCGKIVGTELPYLDHLYTTCCVKKATKTLQTSICSSFAHQAGTSKVYKHANRLKHILAHRKTKSPFTKQDKLEWVKTVQRSSRMSPPFCTSSWRCISLFSPHFISQSCKSESIGGSCTCLNVLCPYCLHPFLLRQTEIPTKIMFYTQV